MFRKFMKVRKIDLLMLREESRGKQ